MLAAIADGKDDPEKPPFTYLCNVFNGSRTYDVGTKLPLFQ
jgi:hypothetical protein